MRSQIFSKPRSQRALLIYFATFTTIVIVFFFKFEFREVFKDAVNFVAALAFFDRFIVEYTALCLLNVILLQFNVVLRTLAHILSSIVIMVSIVQLIALSKGHQFISALALENIKHVSILLNPATLLGGIILLLFLFGVGYFIEGRPSYSRKLPPKKLVVQFFVLLFFGLTMQQSSKWLPMSVVSKRDEYFMWNNILHTSPSSSLVSLLTIKNNAKVSLLKTDVDAFRKYGIPYDPGKPYPFITDYIYKGPLPFPKRSSIAKNKKPNVIVFFTEGFSARTVGVYGSKFDNITPNIDKFAGSSMQVLNYYNHTAATYRGLFGQYCSIFPFHGASENWDQNRKNTPQATTFCINKILNKNNYITYFFDSHIKDAAFVDEMMLGIGIDKVLTAEDYLGKYITDTVALRDDSVSDNQFIDGFLGWLREHETDGNQKKPFMVGLYNLGTHAWRDVTQDGIVYKDGKNSALNAVHNWDYAFGKFWEYFRASPYADNTIVILTADHSHYTEDAYIEALEGTPDYQKYFVDRIPFIIYDPTHELPRVFDANYASSIDFAPTLAHLLEIPNTKNSFLGNSLFSNTAKPAVGLGLVSIGTDTFIVNKESIHHRIAKTDMVPEIDVVERILNFCKEIELSDKIWNSAWDREDYSVSDPVIESSIIQEHVNFDQ